MKLFSDHSCVHSMYHAHQQIMKEERKENVLYQRKKQKPNRDIRTMFLQNARRSENNTENRRKSQDKNEAIVID